MTSHIAAALRLIGDQIYEKFNPTMSAKYEELYGKNRENRYVVLVVDTKNLIAEVWEVPNAKNDMMPITHTLLQTAFGDPTANSYELEEQFKPEQFASYFQDPPKQNERLVVEIQFLDPDPAKNQSREFLIQELVYDRGSWKKVGNFWGPAPSKDTVKRLTELGVTKFQPLISEHIHQSVKDYVAQQVVPEDWREEDFWSATGAARRVFIHQLQ